MFRKVSLLLGALVLGLNLASAQAADVGKPAPQFELTCTTTGKLAKLSDLKGKTVVLIWQSISCPWDRMRPEGGYQRYLSPLAAKYSEKGVVFLAINSNKTESVDQVSAYHKEHNIPYPILKDPGNKVADLYGAQTTPHIFIVGSDEAQTLLYKGGVEKAPGKPEDCGKMDEQYLVPALDAILAGQTVPVAETKSKGCSVKRE